MSRTLTILLLIFVFATSASAKDKYQRPGPVHLTHDGEKWAEKTLRKLTLEEKVGQVFMIWCRASFLNVENPEYQQWLEDMQKYHVGSFAMTVHVDGPFLLRSEPYEAAEILKVSRNCRYCLPPISSAASRCV
jgi:beta-N-acetylhexosaminidase